MKDKKPRIEVDALNATKAAGAGGVAVGGRYRSHQCHPRCALCDTLEGDERTGAKIVLKALRLSAPDRQERRSGRAVFTIDKIVSANKPNYGFDAQNVRSLSRI